MRGSLKRADRVGEHLGRAIMDMIVSGQLRHPSLRPVCVTRVRMTDDLKTAKIFVRTMGDGDAAVRKEVMRALSGATGFIRRQVSQRVSLKYSPTLQFLWDEEMERSLKVQALLQEMDHASPEEEETLG